MPRITFVEFDATEHVVDARNGTSLMEAARDSDVPGIEAECGGAGACATCHVYIDRKWVGASGVAGRVEQDLLELVADRREESRVSCQINISDEIDGLVATLPETQEL